MSVRTPTPSAFSAAGTRASAVSKSERSTFFNPRPICRSLLPGESRGRGEGFDAAGPDIIRGMAAGDDETLLARARGGDDQALEELLRRYQPRVYRFGMKMCREADAAQD